MKRTALALASFAALGLLMAPSARAAAHCSNSTLKGSYSATITGTVDGMPLAELDLVSSTGDGTFTGTGTLAFDGAISAVSFTATYAINSDCSGSAVLSTGVTQNLNIKEDGSEVMFIGTNSPSAQVTGDAKRINKGKGD
jgi:hypothetical protein